VRAVVALTGLLQQRRGFGVDKDLRELILIAMFQYTFLVSSVHVGTDVHVGTEYGSRGVEAVFLPHAETSNTGRCFLYGLLHSAAIEMRSKG
jgi:hypothetical protein